MTKAEEEKYIKEAYQALIDRGVINKDMLTPSTVTDEMLDEFEKKYEVKMPSILRTYLKTYCHNITMLCTSVPVDMDETDFAYMKQLESGEADLNDAPELEECWCGIISVPEKEPLNDFCDVIEGFRECSDYIENNVATPEKLKHFIPFADWMNAGVLCFDLNVKEEDIEINDPDTWQICWFDHEEFDWEFMEYINEQGIITGDKIFPDFKTFLDVYFYGKFDSLYEAQLAEDDEELPDKSKWCE